MDWLGTELCGFEFVRKIGADPLGEVFTAYKAGQGELLVRMVGAGRADHAANLYEVVEEIIVSDPPCAAELNELVERSFPVQIAGEIHWIKLAPGVRKPGNWAATAIRVAISQFIQKPEPFTILDLGCGSGIIGIFLSKHFKAARVVFSDLMQSAALCAKENAVAMKLDRFAVCVGDLLKHFSRDTGFDLIVFGAPFYPILPDVNLATSDLGGESGNELAVRFVESVKEVLSLNGKAITYLPDFVSAHELLRAAKDSDLDCQIINKHIMYPFEPRFGFPQSHEIVYRGLIEDKQGYRFTEEFWEDRCFLSFGMSYFVLSHSGA